MNIKTDFPIFKNHPDLVYLDSTATSFKPQSVIDKVDEYYKEYSANIYRGVYEISEKATQEYEATRSIVAKFINAPRSEEVVFTRGTTESINLVAYSLGRQIVQPGDEIVTTLMEHHSNFVPWQQLAFEVGADFKVIDVNEEGLLSVIEDGKVANLDSIVTKKTKILAITYVSNVLGTKNPLKEIIASAKKINPQIIVVVDAAQAAPHLQVDVQELGCDLLAFSSHKMLGPTGVGVLWGKYELLEKMYPFQYGGEMIEEVYVDHSTFKKPPHKFEAGTPHIAGVVAFKEAITYLQHIGMSTIREQEKELVEYALAMLTAEFKGQFRLLGPREADKRGGIIAFTFGTYHPHDIAQILDEHHVAVRAGNHCAMPLHVHYKIPASVRASFYLYNTKEDVEKLVEGLKKVGETLK